MKSADGKQFHCTYPGCDKVFNRRDYLERHATNHLTVKPYVCVQCNRHFSRKDLYDNHLTTKRHARVSHEVEQSSHEHNDRGEPADRWVPISNYATSQDYTMNSEVPRLDMSTDMNDDPNSLNASLRRKYSSAFGEPDISAYTAPLKRPLYISGPGPGPGTSPRSPQNPDRPDNIGFSAHDKSKTTGSTYYPGSMQKYFSESVDANESSSRSSIDNIQLPTEEIEIDMNWPAEANTQYKQSYSGQDIHQEKESPHGRFSSSGVHLNLDSSGNSSSVRSDVSTSEESSDPDNRSTIFAVNERIRNDMAMNPMPYPGLRENFQKSRAGSSTGVHGANNDLQASVDLVVDSIGMTNAPLAVEEDAPKQLNSPSDVVASVCGDKRYAWFFDDAFDTELSKLGYDRCYTNSVENCEQRAAEFSTQKTQFTKGAWREDASTASTFNEKHTSTDITGNEPQMETSKHHVLDFVSKIEPLHHERALKIMSVLQKRPEGRESYSVVDSWIKSAWEGADAVRNIVHPATFDPNNTHLSLLAVLALVGLSLTDKRRSTTSARKAYTSVFLYVYNSIAQVPLGVNPSRLDTFTVNKLQAFSLLLHYDRLIHLSYGFKFTRNAQGRYVSDMFLGKLLATIPHVGQFSSQTKQQPIWATITSESYLFHQGADPDTQWKEWVLIESAKRTAHLALYSDTMATQLTAKPNPVSIFNIDIHMICPEALWQAHSYDEFFYISGPAGIITNVPYLGLIKSLIRFPRAGQNEDVMMIHDLPVIGTPWSVGALKFIAHGLIMIVGKLSGLIPNGDEMLQAVMQSRLGPNHSADIFGKFDRQVQERLYRGLDVWYHYFSATYGDVTDQILRVSGSKCILIRDDFDSSVQSDDDKRIPQYALIIVLCHYSSFIFMHEDLPIVLQVTANLKSWLETHESKSLQMLLDYLYMPLYTNWLETEGAQGIVSASALYLLWMHAVTGIATTGNHVFLSAMIYISAIVMWLYDFVRNYDQESQKSKDTPSKLQLDDFQFMDDAVDYINSVYKHVCGQGPPPKQMATNSVLLLSACLLNMRKAAKPLVEMLVQLTSVMDPEHSFDSLMEVVHNSYTIYNQRTDNNFTAEAGSSTRDTVTSGDPQSSSNESSPKSSFSDSDSISSQGDTNEENLASGGLEAVVSS